MGTISCIKPYGFVNTDYSQCLNEELLERVLSSLKSSKAEKKTGSQFERLFKKKKTRKK